MSEEVSVQSGSIACIGECMIELYGELFGNIKQSFGGDTYNTAVYLRRLLPQFQQVHYVTALGEDNLSQFLLQAWVKSGLKINNVLKVPNKVPGLYQISVDSAGERSFTYWRNDSAAKYLFDTLSVSEISTMLSAFEWVYLSGVSVAILTDVGRSRLLQALQHFSQRGGRIIFDNNYRPILWPDKTLSRKVYQSIMSLADIALLTLEDEQNHFGLATAEAVLEYWSCPELVVKRGSKPCVIRSMDGTTVVDALNVTNVVDTTAAGDSFGAGYVAGRMMGMTPEQSARQGHELAATVIQYPGTIIPESAMKRSIKQGLS